MKKHLLTLTLSSILAIPVVSHAEFKGGFADIGVHSTGKTSITVAIINQVASSVIPLKIPTVFTWVTPDLISTCMRMAPTVLRIA